MMVCDSFQYSFWKRFGSSKRSPKILEVNAFWNIVNWKKAIPGMPSDMDNSIPRCCFKDGKFKFLTYQVSRNYEEYAKKGERRAIQRVDSGPKGVSKKFCFFLLPRSKSRTKHQKKWNNMKNIHTCHIYIYIYIYIHTNNYIKDRNHCILKVVPNPLEFCQARLYRPHLRVAPGLFTCNTTLNTVTCLFAVGKSFDKGEEKFTGHWW